MFSPAKKMRENKLVRQLYGSSTSKYFFELFLFISFYKVGEWIFNLTESIGSFKPMMDGIYHFISAVITYGSVSFYSLFFRDISCDQQFVISINQVPTIQMMKGCTGFIQLFQIVVIVLLFPISAKRKLKLLPASVAIIFVAAVVHYIILVAIAHSYPANFTVFHDVITRVVFYLFFFFVFILLNKASEAGVGSSAKK